MNTEIRNFINEFETIFNGEPWYGKPLMAVINDADPKTVFRKQNPSTHSAYEIVHHLHSWKNLLVKRLNGDSKASISIDSKDDWMPLPNEQMASTWKEMVNKLEQNQTELVSALGKWKDADLDKNFAGTAYPLRTFLNGQIQHDIYHIGQIALALKNN